MSEPGKLTRLYLVRWPDGTVTILSAASFEHAVDRIDEIGDAGACEVTPLDGEVWLNVRPADNPEHSLLQLCDEPTPEVDFHRSIISIGFPVIAKLVETADPEATGEHIDPVRWRELKQIETARILAPSPRLKEAIEDWWKNLVPPDPD